ncbi:ABC transporter ATP-binding protein/permease [Actinomycetospora endophytica]|uniref:ABC transporter ATP-binding protein/permease n=1 Tax=Actinomycetospora endophytica TaxID=2291215 RepID=A0ABS8PF13_9PSEU|nr:ABC transporter ATP-binding protein [Actinomycetospora endophytica]MCD2196759.1 ABC transporter ATP-binding protein/permease [Actinomycetospora endophytica]
MVTTAPRESAGEQGLVRRVVALFAPYRARLLLIALAILVTAGLGIVNPFLTQAVFDDALFAPGGANLGLLGLLVAGMVVIALVSGLIGVGQTYLTTLLGNRVMQELRDRLFAHLQRMHLGFFTSTKTGVIQSRLDNDVAGVQSVVTETASSILSNVVTVVASVIAMLVLSWQLSLVAFVLMPVFVLLQIRVGRVRRRVAASTQVSLSDMSAITQESLSVSGVLLAKVFGRQEHEIDRYRTENARQTDLQVRQTMTGQSFFAVVQAFFAITPAAVYLVAGYVGTGTGGAVLSAGTLVAFTTLQSRLLFPAVNLLRVSLDVQTSLALFGRIFAYLDLVPAITDPPGARVLDTAHARGSVEFDDVWFHYPPAEEDESVTPGPEDDREPTWALRELSLRIEPGQLAAVVGPSGAGKTSLSYLVPRLYDVDRGAVRLDGYDVRDLALTSIAQVLGMVTQDTYLFHATIAENLRYAAPDATDDELVAAARAANIHDRIVGFEQGYDTVVGERGYRLSGGEKQRLAIARVILADPKVLILDEATSALDTVSERLVQHALESVMDGRTTIAIAHRLSTVLAADVIFALDGGRLVESGTHAELLARGGLYAKLYAEQFGAGAIEARCADGVRFRDGEVIHQEPQPEVA